MHTLELKDQTELLTLARNSIEARFAGNWSREPPNPSRSGALIQPRSSFVTLRIGSELRGCCGSLDASRPLYADVWQNAVAAAFGDPRFGPLSQQEWPLCHLHISVLTVPEPLQIASETELLGILRPRVDGLVLELANAVRTQFGYVHPGRATFLPTVWEQLPDAESFLRQLKRKAGWAADFWSSEIQVSRYSAEEFGEQAT
jgi:uncharacterized protein